MVLTVSLESEDAGRARSHEGELRAKIGRHVSVGDSVAGYSYGLAPFYIGGRDRSIRFKPSEDGMGELFGRASRGHLGVG